MRTRRSPMGRARALIVTTLVAGATALFGATTASAARAPSAPGPARTTSLQAAWQSVLAEPGIRHAMIGAYAYDVTTSTPLAAIHPEWRLTPASVTKLYTSAASLDDWGNRFALTTRVAQAQPGGPIYLIGGGDLLDGPFGRPAGDHELAGIARAVAAKVGDHAAGVVGVSTLFSGWTAGPAWDISEVGAVGDPSVSALTSDHDDLGIVVTPGATAGSTPKVAIDPRNPELAPSDAYQLVDDAVTGPAGSTNTLFVRCLPDSDTVIVSGSLPLGSRPLNEPVAIGDPAQFTAALFAHDLQRDGVTLASPATTGALAPGAQDIDTYTSPLSLAAYLRVQNGWSINEMAENLYRLLGVANGSGGSPQDAQAAIDAFLARAGVSTDRVQVDGSGLSPLDEMSTEQTAQMLTYVARQPYFTTFEHSLIHIGRTRHCTFMCGFMDHTAADGTVWLKTGNLANQWNYAGYAHARNGDLIAFALFFDGLQGNRAFGQAIKPIDRMTVDAARWPDEPHVAAAPLPGDDGGLPAAVTALLPAGAVQAADTDTAPGDEVAASVVNAATGQPVAQSNGETELQGGLLGRLATVATFLKNQAQVTSPGPQVSATGPVSEGEVHGSLVLSGHYDPLFSESQLTDLARALADQGIRSVAQPLQYVTADGHPFGDQADGVSDMPYSTPHEDVGAWFAPPSSPLVVGEDQVSLVITGAATAGTPAQVSVLPAGSPVALTGSVATASSGAPPAAVWEPGTQGYVLSGAVVPGAQVTLTVAPPDPAAVAAGQFAAALQSAGISVPGTPVAVVSSPGGAVLADEPAPSPSGEATVAMTDPSDVSPYDMYQQLGDDAFSDLTAQLGSADQIIDPSGNGGYDYLTADSISRMLAAVHGDNAEAPLVSALGAPWIARLPERTTIAGYTTASDGQTLAYTVIINGRLFDPGADLPGEYAPEIGQG